MKKRTLSISVILCMVMALIPFGLFAVAEGEEYTAVLEGQMDIEVSESVPEWGLGELPEASTTVVIGEEATISMSFDEPVKFSGNWTGITIDIPIVSDVHAGTTGAKILSFVVDGNNLGSRVVPIINRDNGGNLCIDIARQWGGEYDPYDLAGMTPFTELEITFIVPNAPSEGFTAYIAGQMDIDVSEAVGEWELESYPGASTTFEALGDEATISLKFDEPVKFTGNWTGITTNIWVLGDDSAETTNAHIVSFVVDGEDLGSREVPLISRDGGGFLCLDIARQWGGDYDPYGLIDMEPFTSLDITFVVPNAPIYIEDAPEAVGEAEIDYDKIYQACIGGTFLTEEGEFDWILYEDRTVDIKINEMFTVVLDMGSDTQTHGEASWGYITVVQTNITDIPPVYLAAYIESIKADGNDVRFDNNNIEVGYGDNQDIRISLTNGWSDDPVVSGPQAIGEFSKLEVTMIFCDLDFVPEFGAASAEPEAPAVAPPPVIIDTGSTDSGSDTGGSESSNEQPGWLVPVMIAIGVVLIAVIVVIIMANTKKKKAQ